MLLNRRLSLLSLIFISITYLFLYHQYKSWKVEILNGGDHWGYYLYLPAAFIHHDLDNLETSLKTRQKHRLTKLNFANNPLGVEETHPTPEGKQVNKYTMGVAILYSPFFFIAHVFAKLSGAETDGYSSAYMYLANFAGLFYGILGLFFLRKFLLEYFSDFITAITLLIVALGTNLLFFSVKSGAMSHVYLFSIYSVLLYGTVKFYKKPTFAKTILVGLCCGFITLIRPTEIICLIIPLCWGIATRQNMVNRLQFWKKHFAKLFLAALAFLVCGLPQLFYWKWLTGHFLHYSYASESFDFSNPHIWSGLFEYKNGWLAYTPIMYFAVIGILILFKRREFLLPVVLFFIFHIYIIYSWWCWNYINGFGSRPMVETYALLSIPAAVFLQFAGSRRFLTVPVSLLAVFFIGLNIFNTHQFHLGVLTTEDANWHYYKGVFGKTKLDYADLVRYDTGTPQPQESELKFVKKLRVNGFEDSLNACYTSQFKTAGKYGFKLDNQTQYSPEIRLTGKEMQIRGGDWIKVSTSCMNVNQSHNLYQMNKLVVTLERGDENLLWQGLRLDNKSGNPTHYLWGRKNMVWGIAHFWIQIPDHFGPDDVLKTYVWNQNNHPIYLDDHTIEIWRTIK